ncbi:glycoside hydrolase domain-containing protein [Marimonas sp. MJW-29]|uniref:Glycoside hydrolase domain-containing protein n=1 Tax=Sulfitobacter sediminis TaxID=3234186 RepID=A0ABV3RKH5_9RHOB
MTWRHFLLLLLFALCGSPLRAGPGCEAQPEMTAIDASHPLTELTARGGVPGLSALRQMGVETVIRYYDNVAETLPCKTPMPEETQALLEAGFSVLAVFQHHNDNPMTFLTPGRAALDAQRAIELALANGQPSGSAIYFGVDGVDGALVSANYEFAKSGGGPISAAREATLQTSMGAGAYRKHKAFYDIYREEGAALFGGTLGKHRGEDMLPHVESYFRDLQRIFANFGQQTGIRYRLGAYGGGMVCEHLLGLGLAEICWLSQSKGLPGYDRFNASGRWVMRQELTTVCQGWSFQKGGISSLISMRSTRRSRISDSGARGWITPFPSAVRCDATYAWEE